jgi:hypothetical protein
MTPVDLIIGLTMDGTTVVAIVGGGWTTDPTRNGPGTQVGRKAGGGVAGGATETESGAEGACSPTGTANEIRGLAIAGLIGAGSAGAFVETIGRNKTPRRWRRSRRSYGQGKARCPSDPAARAAHGDAISPCGRRGRGRDVQSARASRTAEC